MNLNHVILATMSLVILNCSSVVQVADNNLPGVVPSTGFGEDPYCGFPIHENAIELENISADFEVCGAASALNCESQNPRIIDNLVNAYFATYQFELSANPSIYTGKVELQSFYDLSNSYMNGWSIQNDWTSGGASESIQFTKSTCSVMVTVEEIDATQTTYAVIIQH